MLITQCYTASDIAASLDQVDGNFCLCLKDHASIVHLTFTYVVQARQLADNLHSLLGLTPYEDLSNQEQKNSRGGITVKVLLPSYPEKEGNHSACHSFSLP